MPHPISWFEINTPDYPTIRQWYADAFGWEVQPVEGVEGMEYALVINAGSSSLKFCVYGGEDPTSWRLEARGQIEGTYWRKLLAKELGVALLNGAVWGTLLGALAYAFYDNIALGGVLALAMMLNLVLAALVGVAIPWTRARLGRDPAAGASVLITG